MYEGLYESIIQRSIEDYMTSTKRIFKLTKELEKCKATNEAFRPRKKGESLQNYTRTKQRHTVKYFEEQIEKAIKLRDDAESFFLSDWYEQLSDAEDGKDLLNKMDELLEKEGIKVTR